LVMSALWLWLLRVSARKICAITLILTCVRGERQVCEDTC
jgi:hypothetical protein